MSGLTMADLIDSTIEQFKPMEKTFQSSGNWKLKGNKLYISDENGEINANDYYTVELSDSELKLIAATGDIDVLALGDSVVDKEIMENFLAARDELGEEVVDDMISEYLDGLFPMVLTKVE